MGLYEKSFDFGLELSKAKFKVIGLIILFLVILLILYFLSVYFFQPQAITASLNDNPLHLKQKRFTLLNIVITNVTSKTARNIEVRAEAEDKKSIAIGSSGSDSEKIDLIESGLNRKIHFLVWPKEGIKEGNYRIKIFTTLNGQTFEKSIVLQVFPD